MKHRREAEALRETINDLRQRLDASRQQEVTLRQELGASIDESNSFKQQLHLSEHQVENLAREVTRLREDHEILIYMVADGVARIQDMREPADEAATPAHHADDPRDRDVSLEEGTHGSEGDAPDPISPPPTAPVLRIE